MKKRIYAALIDLILLHILQMGIFLGFAIYTIYNSSFEDKFSDYLGLIVVIFSFTYLIVKDYVFRNQSIGKKILKIEIVMQSDKSIPSYSTIFIRNITWIFSTLEIIVFIIKGKRFGEIITNTEVREIPVSRKRIKYGDL